jgi:outer membrane protein assembly factor BamB
MHNLPNSAFEKLKTVLILILLFWQPICPQKNRSKQTASATLENCWTLPLEITTDIGIASDNDQNLYIPLVGGKLLASDSGTGKKRWETELGGDIIAFPMISGDYVYTAAKYIVEQSENSFQNENKNGKNRTDNSARSR